MAKELKDALDDPDTSIAPATALADKSKGEVSPAADQSNRDQEMAARMQITRPKVRTEEAKAEVKHFHENLSKEPTFINDEGEVEYRDPDDFEKPETKFEFPKELCANCLNHGRENKLDNKGFCKKCGFKLNRVYNMDLEPARKPLPVNP